MKAGLLSNSQHSEEYQWEFQTTSNSKQDAVGEGQRTSNAPLLTVDQWRHNFNECIPILSASSDESRFVGLLIVAKLLGQAPIGSSTAQAMDQVLQAVGWDFLLRLMTPLVRSASPAYKLPFTPDQLQQQAALTGVGLSVISALCQLPDVASSNQLQSLLPGFLHVLSSCSIAGALQPMQSPETLTPTTSQASRGKVETLCRDWPALEDAALCLYVSCTAGDANGHTACAAAVQSGAFKAIGKCLTTIVSTAGQHKWSKDIIKVDNVWKLPVVLVRLLCVLLSHTQNAGHTSTCTQEQQCVLVDVVPVLGRLLSLPEILSTAKAAAAATAARKQAAYDRQQKQNDFIQQLHAQQAKQQGEEDMKVNENVPTFTLDATKMLEDAMGLPTGQTTSAAQPTAQGEEDLSTSGSHPAPQSVEDEHGHKVPTDSQRPAEDPALLQLQSLHALLLILPIVMDVERGTVAAQHLLNIIACSTYSKSSQRLKQQPGVDSGLVGWACSCRLGMAWILRGRGLGQEQIHAALRVCSSLSRLLGPTWMTTSSHDQGNEHKQAATDAVLSPPADQFINTLSEILQVELGLLLRDALHPHSSVPAATTSPPQPSDKLVQELHDKAAQIEDLTSAMSQLHSEQQQHTSQQPVHSAMGANMQSSAPGDDGTVQSSNLPVGASRTATAGQRATQLLPCVLGLLEGLIEVLASQDSMMDDDEGMMSEGDLLALETQQKLMMSITASVRLVVQFFSTVQQLLGNAKESSSATTTGVMMPPNHAVENTATMKKTGMGSEVSPVEADLAIPSGEVLLACTRFVGSFLSDASDALDEEMISVLPVMMLMGIDDHETRDSPQEAAQTLSDMAVQFLLPGLLQVSCSASSTSAVKLRRQVQSGANMVQLLEGVIGRAAQHATSAHASNDVDSMKQAERLLADTCMFLLNTVHDSQRAAMLPHGFDRQNQQGLLDVVQQVVAWYRTRVQKSLRESQPNAGVQSVDKLMSSLAVSGILPRSLLCTACWCMSAMQHVIQGLSKQVLDQVLEFIAHTVAIGHALALAQSQNVQMSDAINLVVEDFAGDGEQCFEWLLDMACACVGELPGFKQALLKALAVAQNVDRVAHQDVADQFPAWTMLMGSLGVDPYP